MKVKEKILIRIKNNESCIKSSLSPATEKAIVEDENKFLRELLKDLTLTKLQ